ncbi:hypothetical protein [Streptomyces sp900116325]|uniref:hypothetical protein n=1 Tax=Streptomyces sp. 900116325 TaxID=3154295 RepID=UPI0033AD8D15
MSLRPLLDAVWAGALGDTSAFGAIKSGLGTFYLSEYCHNDGPDYAQGPAAASVLHGCTDFALFASCESLEAADRLARGGRGVHRGPRGTAPPAEGPGPRIARYRAQLRRARFGLDPSAMARLRVELRNPLSQPEDLA